MNKSLPEKTNRKGCRRSPKLVCERERERLTVTMPEERRLPEKSKMRVRGGQELSAEETDL